MPFTPFTKRDEGTSETGKPLRGYRNPEGKNQPGFGAKGGPPRKKGKDTGKKKKQMPFGKKGKSGAKGGY